MFLKRYLDWHDILPCCQICYLPYGDLCPTSRYVVHGQVITSHSIQWCVLTHPFSRKWDYFNIKRPLYRNSYYKDKTISWPSYLHNGNFYSWEDGFCIEKDPCLLQLSPDTWIKLSLKTRPYYFVIVPGDFVGVNVEHGWFCVHALQKLCFVYDATRSNGMLIATDFVHTCK